MTSVRSYHDDAVQAAQMAMVALQYNGPQKLDHMLRY